MTARALTAALLLTAALAALAPEAAACNRCGLFGNRCRYYAPAVAVAPVQVVKSPEVFVVQNNYPPANGAAALLAQQGHTVYGYQAAALQYQLDPAAVLRQAADLAKGAQALAATGLDGYNQSAGLALQLNAQIQEPLAKGVAASAVLHAAGLAAQPEATSQTLRIYKDPTGRWQIEHQPQLPAPQAGQAPAPPARQAADSLLAVKCGSCHGAELAEPKGGLYFAPGQGLECSQGLRAVRAVRAGTMPKGQALTAAEREALTAELLELTATD